jgi:hypothetical protein
VDEFEIQTVQVHVGVFFNIDFRTSHPGVLTSGALPQAIDPRDFELASFFVNDLSAVPPDPSIPRFGGTIDALAVAQTPLPGSLGLFAPALVGLLGLGGWKRRRAEM